MKTTQWRMAMLLAALPIFAAAQETTSEPPATAEVVVPRQGLTFFDSKLFDSKLSQELGSGKDRVEVEISGKVTLAAIPERIDKWITRVGEEGKVEIREGPSRTRAIFALLPMLFSAFQQASEERMLEPAKDYNATIIYRRDAGGDTLIDRIVFTRRQPK